MSENKLFLSKFLFRPRSNSHPHTIIILIVITAIGFYTKFYTGPGESWVNNSLGGVFYEIFWCMLIFLFFQNTKPFLISISVLIVTFSLEFLQLWHPRFLETLRSNFIGRTILGNSFNWSDFIYYIIGSGIGYFLLIWLKKSTSQYS